jgi:hypothetical protein
MSSHSETHSFTVSLACELGSVDLALILNHFLHWIGINKRGGRIIQLMKSL